MILRKAMPKDAEQIAALFLLVMKFMVYRFIGEENPKKVIDFFVKFIRQQHNQYSYQNCIVCEADETILGVITIYDGGKLQELRQPILDYVHLKNPHLVIEDETQAGEIYIDVLSVNPLFQGQGIGTRLLSHVISELSVAKEQRLGLLVDKTNPEAKKLYLKLGFEVVGEKTLSGHDMEHLQRII